MKELFINVINNGDYELRDILFKINTEYVKGNLTYEDMVELEDLARNNANPINSYVPIEVRLEEAFRIIEELENKVKTLEATETKPSEGTNEPSEEVVIEEYPEYKQPMGAHDSYKIGDKVTFNGKKYVSLIDGNNWSPSVYPQGWEEVKEVA